MNILRTITPRRGATILSVLALSLALHGCLTEERQLNGSVPITIEAAFTTQGTSVGTTSSGSIAPEDVDAIFEALDDADFEAVDLAVKGGKKVLIGGVRAVVTENRGNNAARVASLSVDTGTGPEAAAEVRVPDNAAGTEATAANGRIVITDSFGGLVRLRNDLQDFLEAYLAGDRDGAEAILTGVEWSATWEAIDPAPSQAQPDDFDWTAEIVVLVPARYVIDVPSF